MIDNSDIQFKILKVSSNAVLNGKYKVSVKGGRDELIETFDIFVKKHELNNDDIREYALIKYLDILTIKRKMHINKQAGMRATSLTYDNTPKFKILTIEDNHDIKSYYMTAVEINSNIKVVANIPYLYRYCDDYIRDVFISRYGEEIYKREVEEEKNKVSVGSII